jgi:acyl-CoA synthetase (NDP forming)/RimJ/RimL family protein N-acetyltransferase
MALGHCRDRPEVNSMTTPAASPAAGVYALLTDGTTVEIRPALPGDLDAVRRMYAAMSQDNMYLRFFNVSRRVADMAAKRCCREPGSEHAALLAWVHADVIGVAGYEPTAEPGTAEIAFAVADHMHGRGVATLLLEHLVSIAQRRGLQNFTARALPDNLAMLRVFASAGLPARRQVSDEAHIELTFPLPHGDADQRLDSYLEIVASRESHADVASLHHLLRPASVAVVGTGRGPGTAAFAIARNIAAARFAGRVYAVNIPMRHAQGATCLPSVGALPEPVDLALVTVPAEAVRDVTEECGRRGVRSVVVTAEGLDAAAGADLLAICRRHGMRLAGPGSSGAAVPAIGLDATLARHRGRPGPVGLVVQSGGIGIALLARLSQLGIGISSFASVGDKYDVSGNDLLMWWEQDGATRMAVLCLESFGNPRKFARTARRLGQQMPVLAMLADPHATGAGAADAHATTAVTPLATREALFRQAGIIAVGSIGELVDAVALLSTQPLPAGDRVAIVSNAAAGGLLAAGACGRHGLRIATLTGRTRQRLRRILPPGATVDGPVDTTTAVGPDAYRACLEEAAADDRADMLLAVTVATALADLGPAIGAARVAKPLAAVILDQSEAVKLLCCDGRGTGPPGSEGPATVALNQAIPAYATPESAARALGHAARHRRWREQPGGQVPDLAGLRPADARRIIDRFLTSRRTGGWLSNRDTAELLSCYAVPLEAARRPAAGAGGIEVLIGVVTEPVFGPLVVLGAGSGVTDALDEPATRLTPLTRTDAEEMISKVRAAHVLLDQRGRSAAGPGGLTDMLLRVSRLADDVPEIARLDLGPIIAVRDRLVAVAARVHVAPAQPQDPFLRRLR